MAARAIDAMEQGTGVEDLRPLIVSGTLRYSSHTPGLGLRRRLTFLALVLAGFVGTLVALTPGRHEGSEALHVRGMLSLVEAKGKAPSENGQQGRSKRPAENFTEKAGRHRGENKTTNNFTIALVMKDVKSTDKTTLSARKGDVVHVQTDVGDWSYAYKQNESGYLPNSALNVKSSKAIVNFSPSKGEIEAKSLLPLETGETVWIGKDSRSSWVYAVKPASTTGSEGGLLKGYVPAWYLSGHERHNASASLNSSAKEQSKEDQKPAKRTGNKGNKSSAEGKLLKYGRLYEVQGLVSLVETMEKQDKDAKSGRGEEPSEDTPGKHVKDEQAAKKAGTRADNAKLGEGNGHGQATQQLVTDNLTQALVLKDVDGEDDKSKVSAKKGDVVTVHSKKSGWTYVQTQTGSGYLPSSALNGNSSKVAANFAPSAKGIKNGNQMPVKKGDTVWIISTPRSDWAYVIKPAKKTGGKAELLRGYVPEWALAGRQRNQGNAKNGREAVRK